MSLFRRIRNSLLFSTAILGVVSSGHAIAFDVQTLHDNDAPDTADGINMSATGTSAGVGWSVDGFNTWLLNTNIDDSYTGFNGGNFSPALAVSDRLHTFGTDMSIEFDQKISSILFYVQENSGNSTLDFGLVPTLVSGGRDHQRQ